MTKCSGMTECLGAKECSGMIKRPEMKAAEKSYRIHVGHVLYLVYQKTEKTGGII